MYCWKYNGNTTNREKIVTISQRADRKCILQKDNGKNTLRSSSNFINPDDFEEKCYYQSELSDTDSTFLGTLIVFFKKTD